MTNLPQFSGLGANIVAASAKITMEEGFRAATLRSVAKKAGVQLPQIYHHIGNMEQLADATASYLWIAFLEGREENPDSIPALVDALETQIHFGLTYSELYLHISAPRKGAASSFWDIQSEYLKERIKKVAKDGYLRVSESQATEYLFPFSAGMIITCLQRTSANTHVSWLALQAVKPLLYREETPEMKESDRVRAHASALKTYLGGNHELTLGERALMWELLNRIAST